jgi:hypothetical protein
VRGPFEGTIGGIRALLALVVLVLGALLPGGLARADDDVVVPVERQVELMVKVAGYDKNLSRRAGDRVRTAVLAKADDADASRTSSQLLKALADKPAIAGIPHEAQLLVWSDAAAVAQKVRALRLSILYLTPGFSNEELAAVARALDGVDVLTVSSVPSFVPRGIVLGFDLVSGKPKLLVHLGQARRQNVALSAEVLKLMRVYE